MIEIVLAMAFGAAAMFSLIGNRVIKEMVTANKWRDTADSWKDTAQTWKRAAEINKRLHKDAEARAALNMLQAIRYMGPDPDIDEDNMREVMENRRTASMN